MQFIGRKKELQRLENLYHSKDAFMLLTGRRYVGKTTLVKTFAQGKNALYFAASNVSDTLNRQAFYRELKNYCQNDDFFSKNPLSWRDMLMEVVNNSVHQRKVLIIDNFHYLAQANPEILNILKNVWNNVLCSNYVMVILVVPRGRMLLNLQEQGKSFLSSLTHRMRIGSISFREMMDQYAHHDFNQLMTLYSITGGVPKYWEYFRDCIDKNEFITAISDFCMNPFGDLMDEPIKLIEGDVAMPSEFHSVLYVLATRYARIGGCTDIGEIAGICGYKPAVVADVVDKLIALNFVETVSSVAEPKGFLAKPINIYRICDPYMAFWYTFVFPFYEDIKNGDDKKALAHLKEELDNYVGTWFKQVSAGILKGASTAHTIPVKCDVIGPFFTKNASIDLLGIDHENEKIFFGDCCYDDIPYDKARFDAFVESCKGHKALKSYRNYTKVYGVFANKPFEKELMEYALLTNNVLLFSGITLYSLNA